MLNKYLVDIDEFEIIKIIGSGSFGQVYLAKNKKTQNTYAAKVCSNQKFSHVEQKTFLSEIEILIKIQNQAILSLHGFSLQNFYPHICDFGLSKITINDQQLSKIMMKSDVGTLIYSAPEQLSDNIDHYNYKIDVYSYSLIVYEIITGNSPLIEQSTYANIHAVVNGKRPDISMITKELVK